MKPEKNRIGIGSCDIYITEFEGSAISDIPTNAVLETDANFAGRTVNGAILTYTPSYFTAKSDDGEARRDELIDENVTFSFGLITWNGDTIEKIIPTAEVTTDSSTGERTTLVGGIKNKSGKRYLVHAVHKDSEKGDIRYTFIGKNTGELAAAYRQNEATTITPSMVAEPFDGGRLYRKVESLPTEEVSG